MVQRIAAGVLLFGSALCVSADPWPAEDWASARNLSAYDAESGNDLSGAFWNPDTRKLWVCRNGPGGNASKIWVLKESAPLQFAIDTRDGNAGEWTGFGDLEGLTIVDPASDVVHCIIEGEDRIKAYDLSTYGTAVLRQTWDTKPHLPTSGGLGAEGITFVPDAWLAAQGFVDAAGAPYVSRHGMGGVMLVAHQNGGRLYAFDLNPTNSTFSFVGAYRTSFGESCGLEFDHSTGHLHVWHGNANDLEVVSLASTVEGGERRLQTLGYYDLPGAMNLEGIALTPAASGEKCFFMTRDDGGADALRLFTNFNTGLPALTLDVTAPLVTITVPTSGPLHLVGADKVALGGQVSDDGVIEQLSYRVCSAGGDTTGVVAMVETMLLPRGTHWRFLDDGTDPGVAWRDTHFDDAGWDCGAAPLGYGDGDEATVVSFGPDPANKHPTTYFRTAFVIPNPSVVAQPVHLQVQRDDGIAVYLNGTEVMRDNLPTAPAYGTWASNSVPDDGDAWLACDVDAALLVPGTNVIAVELHQSYPGSSDAAFDLEMTFASNGAWSVPEVHLEEGTNDVAIVACDAAGNGTTNALTVVYSRDLDADGLEDAWELTHFGSTGQSQGAANDDFDSDGFSDADEFRAGTTPTDPSSRLVFTSVRTTPAGQWVFSWQSESGRNYDLLASTNLLCGFDQYAATGLPATPPINTHTVAVANVCHLRLALAD